MSIEGQFYLFFPLLWVIIFKKSGAKQRNIVLLTLVIAISYFLYDIQLHAEASFYSLLVRAWEFLAGACLVVLPQHLPGKLTAKTASAVGLACLVASGYFLNASLLWPGYWTLLPVVGTLLVLAAREAASSQWLFNNWLIQRTGDTSYSLYLWHWPLIVFAKQYASIFDRSLTAIEIIGLLMLTITLAALSWRFVETPIRRNKLLWRSRNIGVATVIVLFSFWGAWRFIAVTYGAPSRLAKFMSVSNYENTVTPQKYFHICFSEIRTIDKNDKLSYCNINATSSKEPSFVVWGDSHAHQYYPALVAASENLKLNGVIATRAACRPTMAGEKPHGIAADGVDSCIVFNNKVNQFIATTPSLKTIVLGRQWFEGASNDQTLNLVRALTAAGKKVVLVGPIPLPRFQVPHRWLYKRIWAGEVIKDMAVPLEDQRVLFEINQWMKEQLAPEIASGQVVCLEAMKHFCDTKECFYFKNGVSSFIDTNHITETKALDFVDEFKRALKE